MVKPQPRAPTFLPSVPANEINTMKILAFLIAEDVRCAAQQLPALRALGDLAPVEVIDPRERPEMALQYDVPIVPTTVLLDARNRVCAVNHGYVSSRTLRAQMATPRPDATATQRK
jgi:hypothetical protein